MIDAWKDLVGVSNGAACTSQTYTCSHVLSAMRLPAWRMEGAVRLSWCAETPEPEWGALVAALEPFRDSAARRAAMSAPRDESSVLPPLAVHDAPAP